MLLEDSFPRQLSLGRGSAVRLRYDGVVMAGPDDGFSDNLDGELQSCEKEENKVSQDQQTLFDCKICHRNCQQTTKLKIVYKNSEFCSSKICRTLEKVLKSR